MRRIDPTVLPGQAQQKLLDLLLREGIKKAEAGRAIDRLGWVAAGLLRERTPSDAWFSRERPEDPARSERELLTDIDRVQRAVEWQAEGGSGWFNQQHTGDWYLKKLSPLLKALRKDTVQSIANWEAQEASMNAYKAELQASRITTKPRKIMVMAEKVAQVWIEDLGLEPRRSAAFRQFLNIATEDARQDAGLGEITDRQLDRLVPRLRAKFNIPSSGGRPRKTPPK